MEATAKPPADNDISTQFSVRNDSGMAQAVATAGLRRNFQPLNPSIGASFQAPPTAVSQPLMPAKRMRNHCGWTGSASWMKLTATQVKTVSPMITKPMA